MMGKQEDMSLFTSIDPSTGENIETFAVQTPIEAADSLAAVSLGFHAWRDSTFETRSDQLKALGEVIGSRSEELARAMSREMGKPITEARAELNKCAFACEYFADAAPEYLAPQPTPTIRSTATSYSNPSGSYWRS